MQTDLRRIEILNYKVREYQLQKAWRRFENAGFKPILIKGWAAAQLYPQPSERRYNDVDLIIEPARYKEALEFQKSLDKRMPVDLHKGARHLDTLSFENLFAHTKIIDCDGTPIRVLRPEDHLRVLCVHWLTDGGANKNKLYDIYYAVKNRPPDFDWDRCLNSVSPTRKRWVIYTIGLACKYLGLNVGGTPAADKAEDIPRWLTETVEREWKRNIPLISLHNCLSDKKRLIEQIKKRFPPNPIQATVNMEGEFDEGSRIYYQIGDVFFRLPGSLGRISKTIFERIKTISR